MQTSDSGFAFLKGAGIVWALLGLVFSVSAETVTFPNEDGSGDISSDAAWGGAKPALTDTAVINGADCTYTAKSDVEFGFVEVVNPAPGYVSPFTHHSLTLDMRNSATGATADNPRTIRLSGLNSGSYAMDLTARGGVWDFKNGYGSGCLPTLASNWTEENSITFSDGAVVKGIATGYYMFWNNTRSRFRLTGGSSFSASTFWPFNGGTDCSFEVLDGSSCTVGGLQFGRGGSPTEVCTGNRFVVAGQGSRFEAFGYTDDAVSIGYHSDSLPGSPGNVFCVTNGASVSFSAFVVGSTHSNTLWLDGGATLSASTMRVGYRAGATNNLVFVGKSSELYIQDGSCIYLGNVAGADGNMLVVSNGYVRTPFLGIGLEGACNNLLRVYGPDAVLDVLYVFDGPTFRSGATGRGNALEIDGGATVDWTKSGMIQDLYMGGYAGAVSIGNEVRLRNGSMFKLSNCYLGHTNSTENVISIDGGSQVNCKPGYGEVFHVYPGNTLKLTVPAEGYPEDGSPVLASDFIFDEGSALQIDASAYRSGPKKCVVFTSWKPLQIAPSVLEAANAALGKAHTLKLSEDKMTLFLCRHEGLSVIIR